MTPFEVVYGQKPPIHLPYVAHSSLVEEVNISLQARESPIRLLKHHLQRAQSRMKEQADKKRSPIWHGVCQAAALSTTFTKEALVCHITSWAPSIWAMQSVTENWDSSLPTRTTSACQNPQHFSCITIEKTHWWQACSSRSTGGLILSWTHYSRT